MSNVIQLDLAIAKREIKRNNQKHMDFLEYEMGKGFGSISFLKSEEWMYDGDRLLAIRDYAMRNDAESPTEIIDLIDYLYQRTEVLYNKMLHLKNSKGE